MIFDTVNAGACLQYLEYTHIHGEPFATMDYEVSAGGTRICRITTSNFVHTFSQLRNGPVVQSSTRL